MIFVPVLVINLILLVITILLAIADRLLVSYGECKITVHQEGESKEFTVDGGGFLLSDLTSHGISITSSCAGKASCGYCKVQVQEGGGQILPTEEIFMSREEKLAGMRLACQVKVKNDLDIFIPDFLTTVRGIVKNKTYDPKLRWKFIKDGYEDFVPEKRSVKLNHKDKTAVDAILDEFEGRRGSLMPILQRINNTFNYLPEPVLRRTAKRLGVPMSSIFRLATFYNAFSLEPKGKNIIRVCMGTACHVKRAADILSTLERELGIETGETTKDMLFTLDTVMCIGCCGLAPVVKVNDDVHGLMTRKKAWELVKRYKELNHAKVEN